MNSAQKGVFLKNVVKEYDGYNGSPPFKAVDNVSLDVPAGEFVTLLGPSGCGKTTTLRMIAGFEFANEGDIFIGDARMNNVSPNKRNTAMVFQSYALFPHLNIFDNVAYGLKIKKLPAKVVKEKVNKILEMVGLDGLSKRSTGQISGGQQQRVALARALVMDPDVLLFDEPLSNLDAKLRVYMRNEIKRIQKRIGVTAIYVTHDQSEAMSLSDRIIIMNKGIVEQVGTPDEIYNSPASQFVAEFIGNANFLKRKVESADANTMTIVSGGSNTLTIPNNANKKAGDECVLVLRPEAVKIGLEGMIPGIVTRSTFMGHVQEYEVKTETEEFFIELSNPRGCTIYNEGEKIYLSFDPTNVHVL